MMKKYVLSLISLLFLFSGCGGSNAIESSNSGNTEENNFAVAVTNTFSGENCDIWQRCIGGADTIQYQNAENEWISFDTTTFSTTYNVNFDSLIGGDALLIRHYGDAYFQDTLPATLLIYGEITKVEVKYGDIYEIILKKDGDTVSFEHANTNTAVEISLPAYKFYCITKRKTGLRRKILRNMPTARNCITYIIRIWLSLKTELVCTIICRDNTFTPIE